MQLYNNYTPQQWIKNLAQTLGVAQHTMERQLPEHHGGPLNNRIPVMVVSVGAPQNMEQARGVFAAEKLNILWGPERPNNSDKRVQKTQQLLEHLDHSQLQYTLWEVQRPVDSLRAIWGNRLLHQVILNDQRTWPPGWNTRMALPWQKEPILSSQNSQPRMERGELPLPLNLSSNIPCTTSAAATLPQSHPWGPISPALRTPTIPMPTARYQQEPSYQAELRQPMTQQYTAPQVLPQSQQLPAVLTPLPPHPSQSPGYSPLMNQAPRTLRMQAGVEATPSGMTLTFPEGVVGIPLPNGSNFMDIAQSLHTLHKWLTQHSRTE